MKHLYIIGNGFDIHTGLRTRYVDFRVWLESNYPFIFENMQAAYDMDVEWWNDFELQLGKLDIKTYIKKFTPPEKSMDEVLVEIKRRKNFEEKYNLPPNLYYDVPCARRLSGLLDVLQYCFEKWVESCQNSITAPKYINLETEDSFFINFNYTDVLEGVYKIPEERVLHIHGRSSKSEYLIYGHNNSFLQGNAINWEEQEVCFELGIYSKNPYDHINKHEELQEILKNIESIHIYGFSFSPVDEDYIDWVFNHVPINSHWEISWFSESDKNRIDSYAKDI